MAFRDDNEALRAQIEVERREARDAREALLEDLEEERDRQVELQRQIEALKHPKQRRPWRRSGMAVIAVLTGVALVVATIYLVASSSPDPRPPSLPKPVVVEAPRPDAASGPVPKDVIEHAVFASAKMASLSEAFLLAAASSAAARAGRKKRAAELYLQTKARFNKIEPGTEDVMAGVLACLAEQVTGIKPNPGQRFADANARQQGDPYVDVAETYRAIALYCQRFELAEAAAEARALALSAATKLLNAEKRRQQLFELADDVVVARDRSQLRQIAALILSIKELPAKEQHVSRAVVSEYFQQLGASRRARELLSRTPRISQVKDLTLACHLACAHALTNRDKAARWVDHVIEMRRRSGSSAVADWLLVGALLALDRPAQAKKIYADKLSSSGQWTWLMIWAGRLKQAAEENPGELKFEEYVTLAVRLAHQGEVTLAKKLGQSAEDAFTKHFILVLVEGILVSKRAAPPPGQRAQ